MLADSARDLEHHMDILRTPEDRFVDLPDFAFPPHYVDVPADGRPVADGDANPTMRMAYVDEGPTDGEVVLCLHGEPSWSFLYRHMVPPLVDAGLRVVCPDLIGFGRSDKPASRHDYTYQRHVDWVRAGVFDALDLRDITLFCQDWGGLIGLRLVAEAPERFARVLASNTFLPTGDRDPGEAFKAWRTYSQDVPEMPIGRIIQGATTTTLGPEVIAGYDAPFPDETYKEGTRQFPLLVPASPEDPASGPNRQAWTVLERFARPVRTAFGDSDAITRGADGHLQSRIPGAAGQPHVTIEGGGHFIQEDRPAELSEQVIDLVRSTPDAAAQPALVPM